MKNKIFIYYKIIFLIIIGGIYTKNNTYAIFDTNKGDFYFNYEGTIDKGIEKAKELNNKTGNSSQNTKEINNNPTNSNQETTKNNYDSFEGSIGKNVGMDFFKKIDSGSSSMQVKFIENELQGSAKKFNDYCISNSLGCGKTMTDGCLDEGKDFTYKELQEITEDGNIVAITGHLKNEYKKISTDDLWGIYGAISVWFDEKQKEMLAKEASMSRVGMIGLFNDGDVNNSGYDLMDDLNKIHKVIFAKDINYNGTSNNSSSDFGSALNGDFNNISSVFDPNLPSIGDNLSIINGILGNELNNDNKGIEGIIDPNSPNSGINENKSNYCETGSNIIGLDSSLYNDLSKQLSTGNSNSTLQGGKGNTNTISNLSKNNTNSGSGGGGGGLGSLLNGGGGGGLGSDMFPCESFICIKIDMIMYKQSLLGGGKSETIEGIIDKHLKIVDKYAGKSLIQSDMTKNLFSLSILRKLNLPSMLHLGIVVTHLPVPILNLDKKSKYDSKEGEFKDKVILERTFEQNGINYITQNDLNPDKQLLDVTNCDNLSTNECASKVLNTQSVYSPYISNVNILESKLGEKYKGALNDDIAEFVGFSNSFKTNIEGILGTIVTMKKTKK